MQADIEKVLIDRAAIAKRVRELAQQITRDLAQQEQSGEPVEITLVPILTGSVIFLADLIRELPLRMQIRVMSVSSYPGKSTASKGPQIEAALSRIPASLAGQHVMVIDDILDSGQTLKAVTDLLRQRNPAGLTTCVLLRKRRPEAMAFPVDYVAFDIPDEFVAGYGLDFDDYYRNLPDIVTLRKEILAASSDTSGNA